MALERAVSARYAVSWLYGEFRIARLSRGRVVEEYSSPELVETPAELADALQKARDHVDFRRRGQVAVLHEHDLHSHEFFEVPAMRRRDLERYLARQVSQNTAFKDEPAWCFHEANHGDGQEGVLLHLLPERIVSSTVDACEAQQLQVKSYVPLTEIVSAYLPTLELDGTIIVVALFRTRVEIIVCDADGEALFVRELAYGFADGPIGRLAMDVNRTIRYTKQQTGRRVDQVRLIGDLATERLLELSKDVEAEVHVDPATNMPTFWLENVSALTGKLDANFVATNRVGVSSEVLQRMGVFASIGFVASCVLVAGVVHQIHSASENLIVRVESQNLTLEQDIAELERLLQASREQADHLARMKANTFNLPTLFVLHLSRITPPAITFNDVSVDKVDEHWEVSIQGQINTELANTARELAVFENMLTAEPWNLAVTESWKESWFQQLTSGSLRDGQPVGFELAGVLR